jgi:hypothetical protein
MLGSREVKTVSQSSKEQYGCTRKRRFATRAEAVDEVRRIAAEEGEGLTARKVYECRWCGFWHFARRIAPEPWRVAQREFDMIRFELGGRAAQAAIRENTGPTHKRQRAVFNLARGAMKVAEAQRARAASLDSPR